MLDEGARCCLSQYARLRFPVPCKQKVMGKTCGQQNNFSYTLVVRRYNATGFFFNCDYVR